MSELHEYPNRVEYHKKRYIDNKKQILEQQRQYYNLNKVKILARQKKYRKDNRDESLIKQREYAKRNREKITAKNNRYKNNHIEEITQYQKEYYANPANKKRKSEITKKRRADINTRKRERWQNDPSYVIRCRIRNRVNRALRLKSQRKSFKSMDDIGCSPDFLVKYIESQFTNGMSWDKISDIHIDHIKPLAMFDLTDEVQRKEVCHYTNLRPLWAKDNLSRTRSDYELSIKN